MKDKIPVEEFKSESLSQLPLRVAKKIFSRDFIRDNNLGAVSSVQTSINLLMKKEIIEKVSNIYYITDVFFNRWIKKEMM